MSILLLELLAEHGAHGTFFILSWVAERRPALVREIAEAGHEIASHGTDHQRVTHLSPDAFRQSLRDSKAILEDVSGHAVLGYRAPSFSITRDVDGRSIFSSRPAIDTTRACFRSGATDTASSVASAIHI